MHALTYVFQLPWRWGPSPRPRARIHHVLRVAFPLLVLSGCARLQEVVDEALLEETPHARYLEQMERAGLGGSRLADAWRTGSEEALHFPLSVVLPHEEMGYRWPEEAGALGFEVTLKRGERLTVALESGMESPLPRIYVEVYRIRNLDVEGPDDDPRPLLVAYNDPEEASPTGETRVALVHGIRVTGTYRIRIHPELLAEFPFRLSLSREPSLTFPVEGRTTRSILSFFGQGRDGGRRQHHGVDIFAPRGTTVLAAGPGRVRRVQETPIGGKVVWVLDEAMGMSRYYAHLDTQFVETGQWVEPGDPIGTVGNTGNAITTRPHLHFGLYLRGEGPVDPWVYLHDDGARASPPRADPVLLGRRMNHRDMGRVRIEAIVGSRYRVRALEATENAARMAIVTGPSLEE